MTNKQNQPANTDKAAPRRNYFNRPFEDSIKSLRSEIKTKPSKKPIANGDSRSNTLPAVNALLADGEDHINIHHHAKTTLGRGLSLFSDYEFKHNKYGKFRTIQGLLCYLGHSTQPDEFRTLSASEALKLRATKYRTNVDIAEYQWVVLDAIWQKVQAYPKMAAALRNSTLPFEYYYIDAIDKENKQYIRVRVNKIGSWLCRGVEEIRQALKKGTQPKLYCFMSPEMRERAQLEDEQRAAEECRMREEAEVQKQIDAERKEREKEADLERRHHLMVNTISVAGFPEDVSRRKLSKGSNLFYVRGNQFRHFKPLRVNPTTIQELIDKFNNEKDTLIDYFKTVLGSNYYYTSSVGLIIDTGSINLETNTYATYRVHEIAYGNSVKDCNVDYLVVPGSDEQLVKRLGHHCVGNDRHTMFEIPALGHALLEVKFVPNSVMCGAEQPELVVELLPENLRDSQFRPVSSIIPDCVEYYTNSQKQIDLVQILTYIQNAEAFYQNVIRPNRPNVTLVANHGVVVDISKVINNTYNIYEILEVAVTNPETGEKVNHICFWYYGDDNLLFQKLTAPSATHDYSVEEATVDAEKLQNLQSVVEDSKSV